MIKIVLDPESPNEITLKLADSLSLPNGDIREYDIFVNGMRVYGRRVVTKVFQDSTVVHMPQGWWWNESFPKLRLPIKASIAKAVQEEQEKRPRVADLTGKFIETVLWSEGIPWRVAHQIEVTSERGLGATYFIDAAHDGSVVRRSQATTE